MAALGQWKHINCLRTNARDDIQDDILRKLVQVVDSPKKAGTEQKSQLETLLSAVDLDTVASMDEMLTVRDVPGGSICFLFEKTSAVALDGEADSIDDRA